MLASQGSGSLPTGSIILWSGYITAIPDGFALCDGLNGRPDLRNRFIVGAGSDSGIGYASSTDELGTGLFRVGDHGGQGMHQLTIAEMPSHNHSLNVRPVETGESYKNAFPGPQVAVETDAIRTNATGFAGNNQPYNIMPPYYSLAYIIKI